MAYASDDENAPLTGGSGPDETSDRSIHHNPDQKASEHRCRCANRNVAVLAVILSLNVLFVICQLTAAVVSHSLALAADSFHLMADTASYVMNLLTEIHKAKPSSRDTLEGRHSAKRLELAVASFGLISLVVVTVFILTHAIERIMHPKEEIAVNGKLMFVFACIGLLFDSLSTAAFCCPCIAKIFPHGHSHDFSPNPHNHNHGHQHECEGGNTELAHHDRSCCFGCQCCKKAEGNPDDDIMSNVNIFSAFSHVVADLFRSISVLIAAVIIWTKAAPAAVTDAWSSILVSVLVGILIMALFRRLVQAVSVPVDGRAETSSLK